MSRCRAARSPRWRCWSIRTPWQCAGWHLSDVATALGKANVLSVVGRLQDHDKLLLLALDDTMRQAQQVRETVVQAGPGGVVRIGDIAAVQDGVVPQWTRVG